MSLPLVSAVIRSTHDCRGSYADLVAALSSILSHIQLPDPSEVGLFNAAHQSRRRSYQLLDGDFT